MSNSIKVGLTGNYLSGVDEVAKIFRRSKTSPVFDCDLVVKYMLFNSEEHIEKIRKYFASKVFKNGIIDLDEFNGFDSMTGNSKFHSLLKCLEFDIITYWEKWRLFNKDANITIFKSQILYEFGFNQSMNLNISVYRPMGIRIMELKEMRNMRHADVLDLLKTEMDENQKNRFSQYVVHNYEKYYASLEKQVSEIYTSIKRKVEDEPALFKGAGLVF